MPKQPAPPAESDPLTAPGGVASVDRALSLLAAFTSSKPILSLSDLAEHTHRYKSTVLRLLASLEHWHFVRRQPDGRFGLGSAVARLNAIYTQSFSIAEVVLPALQELVDLTRESAALHVQQGDQDVCLYRVDSPQPVRDHARPGDVLPLHASVGGQLSIAYTGRGGRIQGRIRRAQVLVAHGDRESELAAIGAPVFGPSGEFIGALVLTMPSMRMKESHEPVVQRIARSLTAQLGGTYPPPEPA